MRRIIILILATIVGLVVLSNTIGLIRLPLMVGAIVFFVAMGVSFVRGTDALYIIVFAMLFSPEIGGEIATGKRSGEGAFVAIRLEDLILIAVGIGWLLRTAYQRRHFGIIMTPINAPIGWYMLTSIMATLMGVIDGRVRLEAGAFHNIKYFEYFFLFFMILAHVRQKETITKIVRASLIVFFISVLYGYSQIGTSERVCAPFDDEPNTFGGYLVLMICVAFGVATHDRRIRIAVPMALLALSAIPPLFYTLSRASYMAMIFGFLAFLVVSRRRMAIAAVAIGFLACVIMGEPLIPKVVHDRVTETFKKGDEYHVRIGNVDLDSSASARIVSYEQALKIWTIKPVLGHGVTGTHFIDGQYVRLLAETGILGLSTFLLVIWRALREVRRTFLEIDDEFMQGVSLGLFCGIIAMMGHAISANSFIIIRIAEPMWLLIGLVVLLPRLRETTAHAPATELGEDRPFLIPAYPRGV